MDFERGYRLRVNDVEGLTKLVTAYRTHALRVMAASYAEQIARTAVSALDAGSLGLMQDKGDFLLHARESVRSAHDKTTNGIYAHSLNCRLDFHFVGNAILALMSHGSDRYRKPWEARREVVRWGWSEVMSRPTNVSEIAWSDRARYWAELKKPNVLDFGVFSLRLIEDRLPTLGWSVVNRCLPSEEWRVEQAVRKLASREKLEFATLSERDRARFEGRIKAVMVKDLTENSFRLAPTPSVSKPMARPQVRDKSVPAPKPRIEDEAASIVDHADIVVAGDGRAFMAVPYVGFSPEDRVHIQVGSRDITFSQNGIQYGTVTHIPASSRDYLRSMTSITLVEVIENEGKHLLRAKHTAMVSDISIGEGLRRPLQTFRKRSRGTGLQEI